MMKKRLLLVGALCAAICCSVFTFTACGEDGDTTLSYTLSEDGDSYSVSAVESKYCTKVVIPSTHNKKPVTSIDSEVFKNCTYLNSVTIPEGVETIGSSAFENCYSLTSVTIPSSVTTINSSAFSNCYTLVEVYNKSELSISKSSSGNGYVAYNALNVYTPDSGSSYIKYKDDFTFYDDGENIYLLGYTGSSRIVNTPNNYNSKSYSIYKYSFYQDKRIAGVVIGDSVTSVGASAFKNCTNLATVTVGSSVTSIGSSAFYEDFKLVEVNNLSSLTITKDYTGNGYVAKYALNVYTPSKGQSNTDIVNDFIFYQEEGSTPYLVSYSGTSTDITLPVGYNDETYKIYKYAFYYNRQLTSVTIPGKVSEIGERAFQGCNALTSLSIGEDMKTFSSYSLASCSALTKIIYGGSQSQWGEITKTSNWNFQTKNYTLEYSK
jgi:hypothetical protein